MYIPLTSLKGEDEISFLDKKFQIRFKPKHAEHIWDNYLDSNHQIKHTEIRSIIKKSGILVETKEQNQYICLAKFKTQIYFIPVLLEKK